MEAIQIHARVNAVTLKLDQQIKLFTLAKENLTALFPEINDAAHVREELKMEGFVTLEKMLREQLTLYYRMEAEEEALTLLRRECQRQAATLDELDFLSFYEDALGKVESKFMDDAVLENKIKKDKHYRAFMEEVWSVRHPNQPFDFKRAYARWIKMEEENGEQLSEDSEDELAIVGEQRTFQCPLTKGMMDEAWTTGECRHTFSSAIKSYLGQNGSAECPVAGCNFIIKLSSLRKDKAYNRLLVQARQAQEREGAGEYQSV